VCDTATTTPAYSARSFASRLARGLCADVTTGRWVSSKLAAHCMRPKNQYLLSLPERALVCIGARRWASAGDRQCHTAEGSPSD